MQRNRLLLLAGAAGAAIVVVVVLIALGSSGSKHAATTTTAPTTTAPAATTPKASIFANVPQHGDTLGRANAPVTLTVFEDPQCPFCRQWDLETLPTVITRYVKTGRVKLIYRGIEIIGPNSVLGLQAIYAAGGQNKLWSLSDELYKLQGAENSGWITPAVIGRAARATGANGATILGALHSAAVRTALAGAEKEAAARGLQGTPTFVLTRPPAIPQQLSVTSLDPATFTQALDAAIG